MDDDEAEHFGYDPDARRVADATVALLGSFYPRVAARAVEALSRALMDDPLLEAFGYDRPARAVVRAAQAGLRARGRAERLLPARRAPMRSPDLRRIRSYPDGYDVGALGAPSRAHARSGPTGTLSRLELPGRPAGRAAGGPTTNVQFRRDSSGCSVNPGRGQVSPPPRSRLCARRQT